jgi:hypothetical protein
MPARWPAFLAAPLAVMVPAAHATTYLTVAQAQQALVAAALVRQPLDLGQLGANVFLIQRWPAVQFGASGRFAAHSACAADRLANPSSTRTRSRSHEPRCRSQGSTVHGSERRRCGSWEPPRPHSFVTGWASRAST